MIIIPIPTSRKKIQKSNRDFNKFASKFLEVLRQNLVKIISLDIVLVITIGFILSNFTSELKTTNAFEFFSLLIGVQLQLIVPGLLVTSLITTLLVLRSK